MLARLALAGLLVLAALAPSTASAANVLVVSDSFTDAGMADALRADGHTVMLVTNDFSTGNAALMGDLSAYDSVFWSATGSGWGDRFSSPGLIAHLTDYVSGGGRLLVTGYNAIGSDPGLQMLLGGAGVSWFVGSPTAVASVDTSLTTGVVDLRGVVPTQYSFELMGLTGLGADTLELVASAGGPFGGGPGSQWTIRTLGSGEVAWVSNGDPGSTSAAWTAVSPGGAGAYNGALRNFAAASDGAASTPGAPRVRFTAPFGADEGAEIVVTVEIADLEGDPVTWSWDVNGDGLFGEHAGEPSYTIAAGTTDGEASVRLAVQASDGTHVTTRTRSVRVRNVAPTITSMPPLRASIGEPIAYRLAVSDPGGAADPLTFARVSGPSAAEVGTDGVFRWTPGEGDVTTPFHTTHLGVSVDDGDGGSAIQEWDIEVARNHAPRGIVALYPVGLVLFDTTPELAVQDATDPDIEPLRYFFEIDRVETFDSPDRQASEPIDETAGYTGWTPAPLGVGAWYWRAWAVDPVRAESERAQAMFWVVVDPATIPDGGPPDAGSRMSMPPPAARGCSCGVGAVAPGPATVFPALLLLALGRRRRRARP